MFLIINSNNVIVSSSDYQVNIADCASRNESVVEIDDNLFSEDMIGSLYAGGVEYVPPSSSYDVVENGVWVDSRSLEELKENARIEIDNAAGKLRTKFITSAPGQELIYQAKAAEAQRYVDAGAPNDLTGYPFITAEVNATGLTNIEAANEILSIQNAWILVGANIEEYRLAGKKTVTNASNVSEINNAVAITKEAFLLIENNAG